jgi:hypothetical protein
MDTIEKFITGVVAIGLITAIGLHAAGLAKFTQSAGQAGSGLIHTAEKG